MAGTRSLVAERPSLRRLFFFATIIAMAPWLCRFPSVDVAVKRVFRLFPPRLRTVKAQQVANRYTRSAEGDIVVPLQLSSPTALLMPFEGFPTNFGDEPDSHKAPVLRMSQRLQSAKLELTTHQLLS
jgi:hypothetical protein